MDIFIEGIYWFSVKMFIPMNTLTDLNKQEHMWNKPTKDQCN